ncbi:uncharacterized protein LOC100375187 [Saccoglossus kowalevskii]|uniref:Uncharacterized protein LOC100375187 n=1 Tax=Saccoglossus kowalevskii TaxID=10224 RepID=A0ABM0GW39_SACKO|nr:PREDICTED: uncharacterized protein LOC100375187 [Saccoglossus kowalevskii]
MQLTITDSPQGTVPSNSQQRSHDTVSLDPISLDEFKTKAVTCGALQISLGVILISLGIASIIIECYISELGAPIWCGVFIVVTGVIGCWAANKQTRDVIITSSVMSLMATVLACTVLFVTSLVAITMEEEYVKNCETVDVTNNYSNTTVILDDCTVTEIPYYEGRLVVDCLILIAAVTEAIVAIINCVICNKVTPCTCKRRSHSPAYYMEDPDDGLQQEMESIEPPNGKATEINRTRVPLTPKKDGDVNQPQLVFQPLNQSHPQHRMFRSDQPQFYT